MLHILFKIPWYPPWNYWKDCAVSVIYRQEAGVLAFNINFTPIYQESDFDRALDSLQTNTRWLRRSGDVKSLPKRKCVAIFLSIEFFDWYILKKTLLIYQSHLEISDIYIIFNMANSVTETPIFSGGELNNLLFCCPKIEERKCSNWIG